MFEEIKNEISSFKYLSPLILIAVVIYLVQVSFSVLNTFSDVVLIVVFAWILNFILDPVVRIAHKKLRVPLVFATLLVYLLFGAVISLAIYFFIPVIAEQIQILSKVLPIYLSSAPPFIQKSAYLFQSGAGNYFSYIPSVAQFLVYFITILVLSFYIIIDKANIGSTIHKITPKEWIPHLNFLEKVIDQTMASFLRVQVIFGLISGVVTFIVLTIFGINFAPSTSVVAGILTVIPVVGTVLALIPPFLVSFVVDPSKGLFILAILLVLQQVIYNVIGPKLIGGAFKVHPIIVMLSLLVGFKMAGIWGSIFAIPVVSIFTVVGKEILNKNEKDTK